MQVTATYEHFVRPADDHELIGAVHILRAVQRQSAAQLAILADHVNNPAVRAALEDAAQREHQSCARLTALLTQLDDAAARRPGWRRSAASLAHTGRASEPDPADQKEFR
jgi:hypothetical protein